jgi:predicted Zn-dependent peptidase
LKPHIEQLPNGFVWAHIPKAGTRAVHAGLAVNVGSRDEAQHLAGMAHFIEHMLFKGTKTKSLGFIQNRIDQTGGELNAYTTKEKTCLHASLLAQGAERAIELLSDMALESVFPAEEIEKEKSVIAEEIDMCQDNPEEAIFDQFDELIFSGHSLAVPILGRAETLETFNTPMVSEFARANYTVSRMGFCFAGKIPLEQARALVHKYFGHLPTGSLKAQMPPPVPTAPRRLTIAKPIQQAHFILGGLAPAARDTDYVAFSLVNYLLGGPPMNTRLNLNIREKYGLTYNLYSFYTPYTDSGSWGVYGGCDLDELPNVLQLVEHELRKLTTSPLKPETLVKFKRQFVASMILGSENVLSVGLGMVKDYLDFNRVYTLQESIADIRALTAEQMLETAQRWLAPDKLSLLIYEPTEE